MTKHTTVLASLTLALTVSAAHAGGFDRGGVNIDQLFDTERYTLDSGYTFVNPQRTIKNVRRAGNVAAAPVQAAGAAQAAAAIQSGVAAQLPGALAQAAAAAPGGPVPVGALDAATVQAVTSAVTQQVTAVVVAASAQATAGLNFGPAVSDRISVDSSYRVPRIGLKANFNDDLACLASYHEPFGGDAEYGTGNAYSPTTVAFKIETRDYGLTCSYRYQLGDFSIGKGYLRGIAGVSYQELDGFQSRQTFLDFANLGVGGIPGSGVTNTSGLGTFDVSGDTFGYRIGLAYEIPEIALRAMVLYHSKYDYDLSGVQDNRGFGAAIPGTQLVPVTMATEIPQAIEVKLQSGIADDTIAFFNFKWQQWSNLGVIPINGGISPVDGQPSNLAFEPRYRDGYTVSAGLGRRFNDLVSGRVGLGWDRGTSTVTGSQTDTYTLSGGLAFDVNENITLSVGGLVGLLTDGSSDLPPLDGADQSTLLTYEFDDDIVTALTTSIKFKF